MFSKLVVVIVAMLLIGAGLLSLRQYRLNLMNQMAQLHADINRDRQEIWTDQARIAQHLDPQHLEQAIDHAQLQLRPVEPQPLTPPRLVRQPGQPPVLPDQRTVQYQGGG